MEKRILGKSGIKVSPFGIGCMRFSGGGWSLRGKEVDYDQPINEKDSINIINLAIDLGVNIFDKAVGRRRDDVIIISKAGYYIDDEKRIASGKLIADNPKDVKVLCDGSLRRLNTDYIDIYLYHTPFKDENIDLEKAAQIRDYMEELVEEGKIRWYGWSTDWPQQLKVFMEGKHCTCTMQDFNIFAGNEETLKLCEDNNLASLNRRPLGGGALTAVTHSDDDKPIWMKRNDFDANNLKKLEAIKEILTSDGRTVVQGALGWLWAKSEANIPMPGIMTEEQVRESVKAIKYGPLTPNQMEEIEKIKEEMRER